MVTVRSLLWFAVGTTAGFVLAHLVNKDPRGHEVLADASRESLDPAKVLATDGLGGLDLERYDLRAIAAAAR